MKRLKESKEPSWREANQGRNQKKQEKVNEWMLPCGDKFLQTGGEKSMVNEGLEGAPSRGSGVRRNEGETVPGDDEARRARCVKE